jgi:hypothetical protein
MRYAEFSCRSDAKRDCIYDANLSDAQGVLLIKMKQKIIEAMAAKEGIYGLPSPKKLNPNLIAVGFIIVILTIILVYSGRHSRIAVSKFISIETNIPSAQTDSSAKVGE